MIVLDTNVLMEILEKRQLYGQARAAIERHGRQATVYVSALTVSTIFYLTEKHKLSVSRTEAFLQPYGVFDVLAEDIAWALQHYRQNDFEDALQVAAALRASCTSFVTIDKQLADKYHDTLPVELLTA